MLVHGLEEQNMSNRFVEIKAELEAIQQESANPNLLPATRIFLMNKCTTLAVEIANIALTKMRSHSEIKE